MKKQIQIEGELKELISYSLEELHELAYKKEQILMDCYAINPTLEELNSKSKSVIKSIRSQLFYYKKEIQEFELNDFIGIYVKFLIPIDEQFKGQLVRQLDNLQIIAVFDNELSEDFV